MVGVGAHITIRNANSDPYTALVTVAFNAVFIYVKIRSLPYQFHDPGFVCIGDGERFAGAVVTVFLYKACDPCNGFAGGFAALHAQEHQAAIIHNAGIVFEFGPSAKSCFANGHLVLIHEADYIVGFRNLWNFSKKFSRSAII